MSARFSEDRRYRWTLARDLNNHKRTTCTFVMLNPSTADELDNDPTVERCQIRATNWGYGHLIVVNIFAYVSTDPNELLRVPNPIGEYNDDAIIEACERSTLTVCAWGSHRAVRTRGKEVLKLIRSVRKVPHALAINGDGNPGHPLYLPYALLPMPMPK